jgi:small subunit ribosomal protein S19e
VTTVYDVPADPLIRHAAAKLKDVQQVQAPDWATYARTGAHTQKAPDDPAWWHVRAAAVLRKVYTLGPIGVERLSSEFGGKRDRGSAPYHAVKGSRSVTRTLLQQLEEAGLVTGAENRKGRQITGAGKKLLDNAAHDVRKDATVKVPALAKY